MLTRRLNQGIYLTTVLTDQHTLTNAASAAGLNCAIPLTGEQGHRGSTELADSFWKCDGTEHISQVSILETTLPLSLLTYSSYEESHFTNVGPQPPRSRRANSPRASSSVRRRSLGPGSHRQARGRPRPRARPPRSRRCAPAGPARSRRSARARPARCCQSARVRPSPHAQPTQQEQQNNRL